jgi:hypothetical protein
VKAEKKRKTKTKTSMLHAAVVGHVSSLGVFARPMESNFK